jgi:hypothetical protein
MKADLAPDSRHLDASPLSAAELHAVSGGFTKGMPYFDLESGEYIIRPYTGSALALYVEIGGRWVPTGSEPFIPPIR